MTVDTSGRVVASHAAYDAESDCPGSLRAWDENGTWVLAACDACGLDVAFRRGSGRGGDSQSGQEW